MADDQPADTIAAVEARQVMSGGIDWYVEQRGSGADIVLIPSGEGDCASFAAVAADLASDYRVTTFDTPGFSRTRADPDDISVVTLGAQIAGLAATLGIEQAVVFGCSSGGLAALDLAVGHPQLARRTIVHEVALPDRSGRDGPLRQMAALDDAGITQACGGFFADFFNEDRDAWLAMGEEYHARLAVNYPVWIKRYVMRMAEREPIDPAALAGLPISWTIGALFPVQVFFSNVRMAHQAGIAIDTLPSRHFPQVSIPAVLAAHIRDAARR